jgi:hypothetical protein
VSMPGFTAELAVQATTYHYRGWSSDEAATPDRILLSAIHWGPDKADQCTLSGFRQHSAILWDIPWGASWEAACASTPGLENRPPDRCVNTGFNMWGEWDIRDDSCGQPCVPTTSCQQDPASTNPNCQVCYRDNCDGSATVWHTC